MSLYFPPSCAFRHFCLEKQAQKGQKGQNTPGNTGFLEIRTGITSLGTTHSLDQRHADRTGTSWLIGNWQHHSIHEHIHGLFNGWSTVWHNQIWVVHAWIIVPRTWSCFNILRCFDAYSILIWTPIILQCPERYYIQLFHLFHLNILHSTMLLGDDGLFAGCNSQTR